MVQAKCDALGVKAILSQGWEKGGEGTSELAKAVVEVIESGQNSYKQLYDHALPVKEKIEIIAKEIYGADGVEYSKKAETDLKKIDAETIENIEEVVALGLKAN